MWGGEQTVPGLREALGLSEAGDEDRGRVDQIEAQAHALLSALAETDWDPEAADRLSDDDTVRQILRFAATEVVPRCGRRPARSTRCCTRSMAVSSRPARPARRCVG